MIPNIGCDPDLVITGCDERDRGARKSGAAECTLGDGVRAGRDDVCVDVLISLMEGGYCMRKNVRDMMRV